MATYGSLPLKQQIEFFRDKLNLPTKSYTDIQGAAHDQAFVVAGALKADLLNDLRGAVDRVVADGIGFEAFKKDFRSIAAKHGWAYNGGSNWRAQVIYETNLNQSYNAGREAQMADPELRARRPYGMYKHYASPNERPEHVAWDGLIIPLDDPWWDSHSPANGWGCKCKKFMYSDRDVERRGLKVVKPPPEEFEDRVIGKRSGNPQTVRVPKGIDPGFAYTPGKSTLGKLAERGLGSIGGLPPASGASAAAAMVSRPAVRKALATEFGSWIDTVLATDRPGNVSFNVGSLSAEIVESLAARNVIPESAAITIRDREVQHVFRETKTTTKAGLPKQPSLRDFKQLPNLLTRPRAVLLVTGTSTLIYVFDPESASGRSAGRIVVEVNYSLKTSDGRRGTNSIRTVTLANTADLTKDVRAGSLELLEGRL
ncbi:phage minor head protein [Nevskia sp.]|uniref:phage head morphogenesis protein n=1 Tax=Nevskia sp. TaxID=1929292 RepID=UPI0025EEA21D|nr:phage minor head protein [Nevskia sp.]